MFEDFLNSMDELIWETYDKILLNTVVDYSNSRRRANECSSKSATIPTRHIRRDGMQRGSTGFMFIFVSTQIFEKLNSF